MHVGVLSKHLLIFLELFPTDIADMMISQQDVPSSHGLAMPLGFLRSAFQDWCALTPSAEHVSTGIDWMLQQDPFTGKT